MRGRDILEVALYGGVTYWASIHSVERDREGMPIEAALIVGGDEEASEGGLRRIRCGELLGAARKVVADYPKTAGAGYIRDALREDDPGYIDAEAADMIVQVALFGEVVYG